MALSSSFLSAPARLGAVAAVIALVAGGILGPAVAASAADTYTPVQDYPSLHGDYGFHLSRDDASGALRLMAFNNTSVAHSFGVGTDGTTEGQVEPLWDDGFSGFSSSFQLTVQAGAGPDGSELPTLAGMTYAFYADLPSAPSDPPAELIGTHREPGHWTPLTFEPGENGDIRTINTGYPIALSVATVNAGGAVKLDVARTGALTSGQVWAVPTSALQSPLTGSVSSLSWADYGAGLHRFDPTAARFIATAQIAAGAIHQQIAIPASLAPGDYDIVVGDPASHWWPIGVTSWIDDHNLSVTAPGATAVGSNVQTQPVDQTGAAPVTITFANVTASGTTTLTSSGTAPSSEQTGFSFLSTDQPVYYDLKTTAGYSGSASVCFAGSVGDHLWHYVADPSPGQWVDITDASQATPGLICGTTSSFSPFAVARPFTFLAPVGNAVLNVAQAGSSVPLKFSGSNKGLGILASGYPASQAGGCGTAPLDPVEWVATAGTSGLSYDVKTSTYTYVWKTDKAWRSTCRTLTLRLADGSTQRATFQFK